MGSECLCVLTRVRALEIVAVALGSALRFLTPPPYPLIEGAQSCLLGTVGLGLGRAGRETPGDGVPGRPHVGHWPALLREPGTIVVEEEVQHVVGNSTLVRVQGQEGWWACAQAAPEPP